MKKYFLIFVVGFAMASCSSNDSDDALTMNENEMEEFIEVKPLNGSFVADAHPTSGFASINEERTVLSFSNFKTDKGPNLLVYLATSPESTDFVNLGELKGTEGDYAYVIPEGTDAEKYNYVVIWCVDFLVSFGHAELD